MTVKKMFVTKDNLGFNSTVIIAAGLITFILWTSREMNYRTGKRETTNYISSMLGDKSMMTFNGFGIEN